MEEIRKQEETLERQIAKVAFEKLIVDELTEQFKVDEMKVKERFMSSVEGLDGARKASDAFGDSASLSKVKGAKGSEGDACYVGDTRLFEAWCRANTEAVIEYLLDNADDFATWVLKDSGELVDGARAEHFKTPDRPSYAKWNLKRDEMKNTLERVYGFKLEMAMPKLLEGVS